MITGIHHIVISVSNLDESIEFYRRLGFEVDKVDSKQGMAGFFDRAFMKSGKALVELVCFRNKREKQDDTMLKPGGKITSFEVDDLEAFCRELKNKGIKLTLEPKEGTRWQYAQIRDNDGFLIEFMGSA